MNESQTISALSALAQSTRLRIFRLLVQAGSSGMVVNEIADAVSAAPATLSFHLKALSHAGLIRAQNEGRFIRYVADYAAMNDLLRYLTENCCGGLGCETIVESCDPVCACAPENEAQTKEVQ